MSSKGAADSTADSADAFKHSPSKQGVPLLQKTFSLGEATQSQPQQPAQIIGFGATTTTQRIDGSTSSNFGVLGLSQVTNSMNPGLGAPAMTFDAGQKNEEKAGIFGAPLNDPIKTGSSTFGFGENGGLGSGPSFGVPGGFGQNQ